MSVFLKLARRCLYSWAFLLGIVSQANAYGIATTLGYNINTNVLAGYSETFATYDDDYAYCHNYIEYWETIILDPPLCTLYEFTEFTYSVAGQFDGPSGPISSGSVSNQNYYAAVGYHQSQPPAGLYSASAEHYVTTHTYYCELTSVTNQSYSCYLVGWFEYFVGNTWSLAQTTCVHRGQPNNGSLTGDTLLPAFGFRYSTHSTNRWGCEYYLLYKIPLTIANWSYNHSLRDVGVGRISQRGGRKTTGESHQNGLDVDIRYQRTDGVNAQYNFNNEAPPYPNYDQHYTNTLIQWFCDSGATVVGVDARAGITASCAQVWGPPHEHHFHVRFPDPDGTNN